MWKRRSCAERSSIGRSGRASDRYDPRMGFVVERSGDSLEVRLTVWDRAMNWRGKVEFDVRDVTTVGVEEREALEALIDHRAMGWGTHNGAKRSNRRRVGTMLGRGVAGKQFWAVAASHRTAHLLVLDLRNGEFARAVLMAEDPQAIAAEIRRGLASP